MHSVSGEKVQTIAPRSHQDGMNHGVVKPLPADLLLKTLCRV